MNLREIPLLLLIVVSPSAVARAQTPPAAPPTSAAPAPTAVATQPAPPAAASAIPLRLAAQVELASGVATGSFHNQLVGGRVDGRFSPHVSLGGYLGFASLKGKDGRLHAALTYAQLEYLAGEPSSWLRFPLRFATGYLTDNGPVVRAAAGLSFAVGRSVDLVTELAPMVWLTNNQTLLSLNLSLELALRL
ncbi:MAG TPA: hypothetical protein VLA14_03605 [Polyangia bacterium]|nr:hypothetical protein [Polyangia bacterium]